MHIPAHPFTHARRGYQVDATLGAREELPDIRPFVFGRIVPDDVVHAFFGVADQDPSQRLRGAGPVDCV